MNRKVVGFEISEQIFNRGIEKMQNIEAGELLGQVKSPKKNSRPRKQGESWTEEEKTHLKQRYHKISHNYEYKKDIVKQLQKEFERGKFGIKRMLKIVLEDE